MRPWRSLRRRRPRGCRRRLSGRLPGSTARWLSRAAQSKAIPRNIPLVHDEQAFGVMSHQIDAKRRHLALYETSCLIYGRTAKALRVPHRKRMLDRRRSGNRARSPQDEQHTSDEVSVMNKIIPTVLLAAAAALVACGGGSGMSSTTPPGSAKLMAIGTITGFGSIYVNGVHFQTTRATIRKNGQVVAQSALKVGEIARIKGSKNTSDGTGNADSVDVDA